MVPFCGLPCSVYDEVETTEKPPKHGSAPSVNSSSPPIAQYGHPVHSPKVCGRVDSQELPTTSAAACPSCSSRTWLALMMRKSASCARMMSWIESNVLIHCRCERKFCSSRRKFSTATASCLEQAWRNSSSSGVHWRLREPPSTS